MESTPGKTIVAVKIDRCWNRHWRCMIFLSAVSMSLITAAMWMSMQRKYSMEGLIEDDWKAHWSRKGAAQKASKTVVEQPMAGGDQRGINVNVQQETMQEYFEEEDEPEPTDNEYYNPDVNDVPRNRLVNPDYLSQYSDEIRKAQVNKTAVRQFFSLFTPKITNYTLKPNFWNPFKDLTDEDIEFDDTYVNPCWSESIPRFPYANNSYLLVSAQARELEPQFQLMRKRFAQRQDPATKWRLRCLPAFYVMETPPTATPSLYTVLSYHPQVVMPKLSEPEYWNLKGPGGVASLRDYVDLFDAAAQEIRDDIDKTLVDGRVTIKHKMITGDGTSSYLWTFDSWQKVKGNEGETEPKVTAADTIAKLTPLAKFVFVLRNPTERLFQGYLMRSDAPSAIDFNEKAGQALEKMAACEEKRSMRSCLYDSSLNKNLPVRLRIGMYYPFIADWLRVFQRDQIKVVRYEDYVANPSEIINEVCKFLGLSPFPIEDLAATEERIKMTEQQRLAKQKVQMLSTTRAMLRKFHRLLNQELAALLGDDKFAWPELTQTFDTSQQTEESPEEEAEKQKKEREKMEEVARQIKVQREQQIEQQRKNLEDYMKKRQQWAIQQEQLRQKLIAEQQEKQNEMERRQQQQKPQQPQQPQNSQQQQPQQPQQPQNSQQQQPQQPQQPQNPPERLGLEQALRRRQAKLQQQPEERRPQEAGIRSNQQDGPPQFRGQPKDRITDS